MNSSPRRSRATLSRRQFLKASAAAVALPYFIPGSALGKDGRPPPSERIVMGGIGIGNQGGGDQGSFLGREDVQYVAVCDVKKSVREGSKSRIDQRYGDQGCATYNDFRELLARPDIDTVHVATPRSPSTRAARWSRPRAASTASSPAGASA
ncbi:MAG: twin-arginine translocation signal domain-containing protein [Acidobacteria bacterium]|nr:twin-arginine translocation signal domain-containing protein [Acidobacteriota bacterium]